MTTSARSADCQSAVSPVANRPAPDSTNPWLSGDQSRNPGTMTCDSVDRISRIKTSTDIAWLRKVLAWADNQLTVRKAAERRLRVLSKTHNSDIKLHD